ncbi:hypothetical protein [Gorillibacterium sp. sgz500922]|uniref:hypothetical protein n=1 Tax=Gorillibacterium sp. sgz500922 TaxID=3446694 RepID=UPI003F676594
MVAIAMLFAYLDRRHFLGLPLEVVANHTLSDPRLSMWAGILLAPAFVSLDNHNRTFSIPVCLGYSRAGILMPKALGYYLLGVAALAISVTGAVWVSYGGVAFQEGMVEKLALLSLLNGATITVPLVVAFVIRDLFASVATTAVFTYAMQKLMEHGTPTALLRFYPPYLQMDPALWSEWAGALSAACISVGYIAAGLIVCFLLVKKRELK